MLQMDGNPKLASNIANIIAIAFSQTQVGVVQAEIVSQRCAQRCRHQFHQGGANGFELMKRGESIRVS
jgi:hypothetical protein